MTAKSWAALVLLLVSVPALASPCPDAPDEEAVLAICGVTAPEDLVLFDNRYLIISSMAPGKQLFLLDTQDDSLRPMRTVLTDPGDGERWGEGSCTPPSAMVSHGLDLRRDARGRWRLLVVSHGERESTEFFEVRDAVGSDPMLQWRGCVITPEEAVFNDVAGLADGGFLVTDPSGSRWQTLRGLMAVMGFDTGRVYRWRPTSGFEAVPNTDGPYPNGITLAADGESFFLNVYFAGEVRQHDLDSGDVLRRAAVEKPDNSNWSSGGELLIASHRGSIPSLFRAVETPPQERNDIPFAIVALDPADFSVRVIYESDGQALGGGTAAQSVGEVLYIGAFRGDRLIRVPLAPR